MKSINEIRETIDNTKTRSAWSKGVKLYALSLLVNVQELAGDNPSLTSEQLTKCMLNGARDWHEYSEGGCALICDNDIAALLCNRTEIIRTHCGERRPNSRETWLDVQARALYQAAQMVTEAAAISPLDGCEVMKKA